MNIVMLVFSDGKTSELREITQNCINSALANSVIPFNVFVYERTKYQYKNATTIQNTDTTFNYNKSINDLIKLIHSDKYVICNNDLLFHKGWLKYLIDCQKPIVSPIDPTLKKQASIRTNTFGYRNKIHFSSWCFMIEKWVWEDISGFDEDFGFWYADDSFLEQLKKIGQPSCLSVESKVTHLRSKTLSTVPNKEEITTNQYEKFYNKYIKI